MYAFGERIQKRVFSESLQRGIQGHMLFEVWFRKFQETNSWNEAMLALSDAYETMLHMGLTAEEIKRAADLQVRVVGFLKNFENTIRQWEIIAVEREFRVPIEDPDIPDLVYAFTPDLIVRHHGAYRIVDWKFPYNFYNATAIRLMPQIPKYIGALREMGWANVKDGVYGFVRYRSLKNPIVNQLYKMEPVTPNRHNIQETWNEYRAVAKEIAVLRSYSLPEWAARTKRVGNNLVCNSCAFKELCAAEKEGSTAARIRQELYVPSTYGYVETGE